MRLDGRVALVTGAASGIGRGVARRLVADGARVVIADIDGDGARELATSLDGRALAVPCDVSDASACEHVVETTVRAYGGVDVLVNNAYWRPSLAPPELVRVDELERCLRVGPVAVSTLCRLAFPHLRDSGHGRVINLGSEMSEQPMEGYFAYAAAKGAIRSMTKAIAREWGRYAITANTLWPIAATPALLRYADAHPHVLDDVVVTTALGRLGDADADIAPVVAFLASDDAAWITGQTIVANGGKTLW